MNAACAAGGPCPPLRGFLPYHAGRADCGTHGALCVEKQFPPGGAPPRAPLAPETSMPVQPPKKKNLRRIAAKPRIHPGAAPGALIPVAGSAPASVRVLRIGKGVVRAPEDWSDLENLPQADPKTETRWVRVTGMGAVDPLLRIAECYGIRRMALEDILSPGWRTKMEEYDDYLFFVLQTPPNAATGERSEHFSLFCKAGLIITFEESATTLIDELWDRLQKDPPSPRIAHQAGLLAYQTLDMIVDRFFPHLDLKDEELADLEECISHRPPGRTELNRLHRIKRDLLTLRRLLSPYRELGAGFRQHRLAETAGELKPYLNDFADHVLQAGELLETYHEVAKSLDEIYQTAMTNRMNEIIKVLTIISTVFMPLSFLAGVYGMNFEFMPELKMAYGYPAVLLIMAAIAGGMLWFFRKKRWL